MLSGIGPAQQLRSHDIAVKVNLPGAGANLNDHTMTPIVWATKDFDRSVATGHPGEHGPLAAARRWPLLLNRWRCRRISLHQRQ